MKRKTIRLAKNTLVVSLPNKWVKQYNIQKGQEIHLHEQGNGLLIHSGDAPVIGRSISLDHAKIGKLIHRYLNKAYEKGVDEIHIQFKNPEILGPIKISLQRLIGYELIKQGKTSCVIKDISGQHYAEFDSSLRRLFLIVNNIMEDGIEALKSNNNHLIQTLITRDEDVNKFTHFCLRVLAKKGYPDQHKLQIYFLIINTLERIGDEFRDLLQDHQKVTTDDLKALTHVQQLLHGCYRLTLKPTVDTAFACAHSYDALQLFLKKKKTPLQPYIRTLTSLTVSLQESQLGLIEDLE